MVFQQKTWKSNNNNNNNSNNNNNNNNNNNSNNNNNLTLQSRLPRYLHRLLRWPQRLQQPRIIVSRADASWVEQWSRFWSTWATMLGCLSSTGGNNSWQNVVFSNWGLRATNWLPIGSMYGIFTYIWLILLVNVGKYTIHGWYGVYSISSPTFSIVQWINLDVKLGPRKKERSPDLRL